MKYTKRVRGSYQFRATERTLLWAAFYTLAVGFFGIFVVRWSHGYPVAYQDWYLLPALYAGFLVAHWLLVLTLFRGEQLLGAGAFLLTGIGVLVQYRYGFLTYQAFQDWHYLGYPLGILMYVATVLVLRLGFSRALERSYFIALPLVLGLEAYLYRFGIPYRGAKFGPGNITPAEFMKPLMLLLIAGFLARYWESLAHGRYFIPLPSLKVLLLMALCFAPPFLFLILLRDFGLLVIILTLFALLLYLATGRSGYLIFLSAICVTGALVLYKYMGYWRMRLTAWLDPYLFATEQGYQTVQSFIALFAGGLIGRGLGAGSPQRIPIVETDFVYAGLGEELGLLGCSVMIIVYAIFFHRGIRIGMSRDSMFAALFSTGAILLIAIQTLINMGGVVNLIPITGITLPFVSKGGSSFVTTMTLMGVLVGLSEEQPLKLTSKKTRS